MRSARGFTLVEVLLATALFGLIAAFAFDVADRATRESHDAEARQAGFERRELAALRLRAAVARATSARMEGDVLALRDADGESRWCLVGGVVTRAGEASCDHGVLRLERRARGTVILVAGDHGESILLGGGAR